MSLPKKVNVIFHEQTNQISLDDINSLECLKEQLSQLFNINTKENNLKIFISQKESKEIINDEEIKLLKDDLQLGDKIIIETNRYDEILRNINISESLKLDQLKYKLSNELDSSSYSIASISGSKINENKSVSVDKQDIIEKRENYEKVEKVEEIHKETSDLIKNYQIVLKEEIEEIKDQMNAKSDIQSQLCENCNFPAVGPKFFCMFCNDMLLCERCELYHLHPLIKYNSILVKNKSQIKTFLSKVNEVDSNPSLLTNIRNSFLLQKINSVFLKKSICTADIIFLQSQILIQPNTKKEIKIIIKNLSVHNTIPSGMILYPINNKDLEIDTVSLLNEIPPDKDVELNINLCTHEKLGVYDIKFTLYNGEDKISCICRNYLKIIVGFDESILYDQFFYEYETILALSTSQKKLIYDIIINEVSNKNPNEIYEILKKYKWSYERALDELCDK